MKVKKLTRIIKGMLAVLIAFTAVTLFDGEISAAEEFDIQSKVTYGENNANAVISLDLSSINKEYTVGTIKDPDDNTMDLTDLKYNVLENGTYNFYVSYFDDSNTKHEYTKMVTVENIKTVDRSGLTRASTDYTSQVVVTDWEILDSGGVPLSETNEAIPWEKYQLKMQWTLTPSGGALLHENDVFTIDKPINETSGIWDMVPSDWEEFTDENNIVLGTWRIYNSKIEVQLGVNAENKQSISGEFISGKNSFMNSNDLGVVQKVKIGDIEKTIAFRQRQLGLMSANFRKAVSQTSNSRIEWQLLVNSMGSVELTQSPQGANFDKKEVYFEDTLSGKFDGFSAYSTMAIPVDLTSGTPSGAWKSFYVTSMFKRISQDTDETYETFKSRLKPLEYGVYTDENDIDTVVVYFGEIGTDGPKYSDIDSDFAKTAADSAISSGYYPESYRTELEQHFTTIYGDGNVVGGKTIQYQLHITESYPKVINDTPKTNTAVFTSNGVENARSATGTLQGISGSAGVVDADKARVWLSDKDAGSILSGVSMKLQRYDGTNWIDYTAWSGGVINSDGYLDTDALGDGTYRFVQQDAYSNEYDLPNSDGYDNILDKVISDEFTIVVGAPEGPTVYMTNVKYKYDVVYDPGTQGTFTTITHNDVVINTATPAYNGALGSDGKPAGNAGYTFTGWLPTVSATVTEDVTYVAQWSANTTTGYKVDHYLEQLDGSYVLKETDSLKGTTGHTITAKAKVYTNYTFDNTVKGTVESGVVAGDESLVLKLYYTIDEAAYTVEHYVEQANGTYVKKDTEHFSELIGTTVTATAKTYTGYRLDSSHVDAIESGVVAGDGTLVLKLYYELDDVGYSVEHYHEQTDGSFQLESSDAYMARAGSSVSATAKTYTTHKHDAAHTSTVSTGVVAHDGSLVLRLYYVLEENPSVTPTKATYKVEHYLEQTDGTYILQDTELLPGKIGVNVSATVKDYSGYTFNKEVDGTLLNGVVLEDGSLVLKLYYTKDGKDVTIINPSKANPKQSNSSVSAGDTTNTHAFIIMLMMSGLVVLLKRKKEEVE